MAIVYYLYISASNTAERLHHSRPEYNSRPSRRRDVEWQEQAEKSRKQLSVCSRDQGMINDKEKATSHEISGMV